MNVLLANKGLQTGGNEKKKKKKKKKRKNGPVIKRLWRNHSVYHHSFSACRITYSVGLLKRGHTDNQEIILSHSGRRVVVNNNHSAKGTEVKLTGTELDVVKI